MRAHLRDMRGHSLVELLFVLLLMCVTAASVAPAARRQRDRAQVLAAREAVIGLLAEARAAAMESGGAILRITADPPFAQAFEGETSLGTAPLSADFGVTLALGGAGTEVELAYDALGLGRVASQTISFRRGDESAELVISGYGRVRRQ